MGSVTFLMRAAPSAREPSAIGSTRMNIQRQSSTLRIRPEMVGPIAGATEMTMEMLPMVLPRAAGGTRVITVVISSGIMIAVPMACTTRPTISTSKPGAMAAISVPVLNRVIAARNTGRVLKRCSRKPVMGITTAMVSMNAVVSHWAAPAVMSRSFIRCGSATPMMVSLRITTNAETSSSEMTSLVPAASGALPVRRCGGGAGATLVGRYWW